MPLNVLKVLAYILLLSRVCEGVGDFSGLLAPMLVCSSVLSLAQPLTTPSPSQQPGNPYCMLEKLEAAN